MGENELISVIIPVHNAEPYLEQCINSIIDQTYRNLEIILVDDGSEDESPAICARFAEQDSRIRVIRRENGGPGPARNTGLDAAAGSFIAFVDSDDWIEPDMYERLLAACLAEDVDFAWCGTIYEKASGPQKDPWTGADREISQEDREARAGRVLSRKELLEEMLRRGVNNLSLWDKLFRAECFREVRLPDRPVNQDILCLYRVTEKISSVVQIGYFGYHYRILSSSQSRAGYTSERAAAMWENVMTMKSMVSDHPELARLYEKNEAEMSFFLLRQYLNSGGDQTTEEYKVLKQRFKKHFGILMRSKGRAIPSAAMRLGVYSRLRRLKHRGGKERMNGQ